MKKLFTILTVTMLCLASCGRDPENSSENASEVLSETTDTVPIDNETDASYTEDEMIADIEELEKGFFPMDETAQEIPEEYFTAPEDWKTVNFENGVSMKVPSDVNNHEKSTIIEKYTNEIPDENKKETIKISSVFQNDWSEVNTTEETPEEKEVMIKWFEAMNMISYEESKDDANLYDKPLAELGIETNGTRYGRIKALLSVTEADLTGLDEITAKTIRYAKGVSLLPYQNAYLLESDTAHIFIHQYGDDSNYWINIMPSENFEYCFMVKAEDEDTALRIAASTKYEN
jgi:hypothetical protein